jgi:hypothetical protein
MQDNLVKCLRNGQQLQSLANFVNVRQPPLMEEAFTNLTEGLDELF